MPVFDIMTENFLLQFCYIIIINVTKRLKLAHRHITTLLYEYYELNTNFNS